MKQILIAGGSGSIGNHLTRGLEEKGYEVKWLSRKVSPRSFSWDPQNGKIDIHAIQWADAIINLAGSGIADKRWTDARKEDLITSRTSGAQLIAKTLARLGKNEIPYIGASAVGYYGNSGESLMTESHQPADQSFMVQCCKEWEAAHQQVQHLGNPCTILRIGVVLDPTHGALTEILKPMRFGLGAYFGDGKMWMPWIHHADLVRMMIWALEQNKQGIFNAVAPGASRNKDFTKEVRKVFHPYSLLLPAPAFVLRVALGEMSAVVLNSNHVSSEKGIKAGFEFAFPELNAALQDLKARQKG